MAFDGGRNGAGADGGRDVACAPRPGRRRVAPACALRVFAVAVAVAIALAILVAGVDRVAAAAGVAPPPAEPVPVPGDDAPAADAAPHGLIETLEVERDGAVVGLPVDRRYLRLRGGDRRLHLRLRAPAPAPAQGRSWRWRLRLDGVDADWQELRWPAEQVWPRLPPGPYRLQVAVDRGAGWEPAEERVLLVDSPWWRTRGVLVGIGALLLVALAAAALIDRGRRRRDAAWQLAQARREEAERQSEAKTRFLATLGHELRTPLTGVLGMAELLQGGDLSAHQRMQVEAIGHAGRHLLRLVNDALDLARIEAGRLGLERRPFALWPLLAGGHRPAAADGRGQRPGIRAGLQSARPGSAQW